MKKPTFTYQINKTTKNIEQLKEQLRKELVDKIDVKQNPNLIQLSESPKCYTINSKNLDNETSWSPVYYDTEKQYKMIIALIQQSPIDKLNQHLRFIIDKQKIPNITIYMNNNKINYNSTLHPDVIKQIKQLVD